MILLWRDDRFIEGSVSNYVELFDLGFRPNLCVPVPRPFPESTLQIRSDIELPDFFHAGNLFVVSERLGDVLRSFDVDAEFLPLVTFVQGKPFTERDFFLVNILDTVSCFDYEESEYEQTDMGVTGIERIVLDESLADGHHLFIVGPVGWGANPNPKSVRGLIECASQELATAILEAGMTGAVFVRPEHERVYPVSRVAWTPPQ